MNLRTEALTLGTIARVNYLFSLVFGVDGLLKMDQRPDISVLIVCYQSRDLVMNTLQGLYAHTRGCTFEVLLTDCSNDGTEQDVALRFPAVRIVSAPENLGFARANNFLANHAMGRFLLLLNPDVEIHENAVGELYACAWREPTAGGWGGQTYLRDGRVDPSSCQSTPNLRRLLLGAIGFEHWTRGGLSPKATQPCEVEALSGAFMMVTAKNWQKMGGFDESFFMYAEELDLCYRLRSAGLPLVMTPNSQVIHLVGSGSGRSPKRIAAITRAKMHFLRKHRGKVIAALGGFLMWSTAMKKVIAATLLGALSRNKRLMDVSDAYSSTAFHPREWWSGYSRP